MRTWKDIIGPLKEEECFRHALSFSDERRKLGEEIYPKRKDMFNAFRYTAFEDLKVVILGQDPYHERGQAMGLAFSVPVGVQVPPSLRNIYSELESDIQGFMTPDHGNLVPWAKQGVLLLNSCLTVKRGEAFSHSGIGWEEFTDKVIERISEEKEHLVFMLWGSPARNKGKNIDRRKHYVLETVHPSPLSAYRGFFGCKHFSKANRYLSENGIGEIDWRLPDSSLLSLD